MSKFVLREILIKFFLVFGSLFLLIIILEISLRVYLKDDYSVPSHRDLLFRKNWNVKFANLNSLGYRDHEFSVEKRRNFFRILAVGHSLTYGEGIKQIDDVYTELLEKRLNRGNNNITYEVLNIAQKGKNVNNYLSILKSQGLSFQPDLVMIGFYINDIEMDKSRRPRNYILPEPLHWLLSRVSYVYCYIYYRYDGWKNKKSYMDYYLEYSSIDSKDWKRFALLWKEIVDLCKRKNIRTLVVILPHLGMLNDDHPLIPVYENVERLSKNNGALVLNLFPALKGYKPSDLWVGISDSHPNEKAHQLFAKEIFRFIEEEKLMPILK